MKGRIPAGLPFAEWLERLVAVRRSTASAERHAAVQKALDRMRETKTEAVLDVLARDDISEAPLRAANGLRAVLFREMISFLPEDGPAAVARAFSRQSQHGPLPHGLHDGLSPHAPYTTTGSLLRAAASLARMRGQWLCIHAAETPEETRLFTTGDGPLRDFLQPFLPKEWQAPGMRPIPWLDVHDCLGPRTLLVHCNDIDEADLRIIKARGCSVVVCPGSHLYFNRGAFPLERLAGAGIPTFLGTDSLASNEDLDMGREVILARELAPHLPAKVIEELAGIEKAKGFFEDESR